MTLCTVLDLIDSFLRIIITWSRVVILFHLLSATDYKASSIIESSVIIVRTRARNFCNFLSNCLNSFRFTKCVCLAASLNISTGFSLVVRSRTRVIIKLGFLSTTNSISSSLIERSCGIVISWSWGFNNLFHNCFTSLSFIESVRLAASLNIMDCIRFIIITWTWSFILINLLSSAYCKTSSISNNLMLIIDTRAR